MNPPFTRPTNHESTKESIPSFAGLGKTVVEQKAMSVELKRLLDLLARSKWISDLPLASHGNAGLASNFLDLAHLKLRPGGVLALVMPATLALGQSWRKSRELLARHYSDLLIVSIAAAKSEDRAFSADTGMAEVMVLARKRAKPIIKYPKNARTDWVSLRDRPRTVGEAYEISDSIACSNGQFGENGIHASLGDGGCVGIVDFSLVRAAMCLSKGVFPEGKAPQVPITMLWDLGARGPLDRDVGSWTGSKVQARGPLQVVPTEMAASFTGSNFPVLWKHDASREKKMVVEPDSLGFALPGRETDAESVWATASRLHFQFGLPAQFPEPRGLHDPDSGDWRQCVAFFFCVVP